MDISSQKINEVYHEVKFLIIHLAEEIKSLEASLLDLKGICKLKDEYLVAWQ